MKVQRECSVSRWLAMWLSPNDAISNVEEAPWDKKKSFHLVLVPHLPSGRQTLMKSDLSVLSVHRLRKPLFEFSCCCQYPVSAQPQRLVWPKSTSLTLNASQWSISGFVPPSDHTGQVNTSIFFLSFSADTSWLSWLKQSGCTWRSCRVSWRYSFHRFTFSQPLLHDSQLISSERTLDPENL